MKELEKFSRIYRAEFIKCGVAPAALIAVPVLGGIAGGVFGSYLGSKGRKIRYEYENIAFNEFMQQLSPYLLGGLGGAMLGSLLAYKNRGYLQGALIGGGAGLLGTALYKALTGSLQT